VHGDKPELVVRRQLDLTIELLVRIDRRGPGCTQLKE